MKILVVSLLRLGDIIQQESLLAGLRIKHPGAEIHLLVNQQFSNVEKILGHRVDRFHYFERDQLQRGLGEAGYNILWSFLKLQDHVQQLNALNFDFTYNFTHNKLSAYLIGALEAPQKVGLHHTAGKFAGLNNKWIRYFNERFSGNNKCVFNYVELLGKSLEIPTIQAEVPAAELKKTKLILFQCLTSDSKKNWGLERFVALKSEIEKNLIDYKVKVLGADFEKEILLRSFSEDDLLICDLAEAQRHLKSARLLVTGDTSIKHLAAQTGIPMVELILGSSDAIKTGAFTHKALQVVTTAPCAPCSHRVPCSQKSHLCAEDISVQKVFEAVWNQLSGEVRQAAGSRSQLEQTVWRHYLDGTAAQTDARFATSSEVASWMTRTKDLMTFAERVKKAIPVADKFARVSRLRAQDLSDLIVVAQDILKSKMDEGGYFQTLLERLLAKVSDPSQFIQSLVEAADEAYQLVHIRQNILFNINLSKEGELYANGIGQLSGCSFEETRKGVQRTSQDADL